MIYLDYSATTKVDKEVLKVFNEVSDKFFGNPNSKYEVGLKAHSMIDEATLKIANMLGVKPSEIIITSGASESNNQAIKKTAMLTNKRHIITTNFEHSSVLAPISYLQTLGFKVSFVKVNDKGLVDLEDLKSLITADTFLVSIATVNSELGFREPIEEIGLLLKNYDVIFHSDITQAIGKVKVDLTNVDLASFSAHKIYGIKGIGGLIKKEKIKLLPLINGGKSTTIYRSGTPQTELICSMAKAMELIIPKVEANYSYISKLKERLVLGLNKYSNIYLNSSDESIPHIINFSIMGKKADDIQSYFASHEIYFSTKTACSSDNDLSLAVYSLTNDKERARASVRVSLSYKTTNEEIDEFLKVLGDLYGNN